MAQNYDLFAIVPKPSFKDTFQFPMKWIRKMQFPNPFTPRLRNCHTLPSGML